MPDFQFDGLADFLAMGGNAFYVWMSYGFFLIVMGFNLWLPGHQRQRVLRLLKARQLRQDPQSIDGSNSHQQGTTR